MRGLRTSWGLLSVGQKYKLLSFAVAGILINALDVAGVAIIGLLGAMTLAGPGELDALPAWVSTFSSRDLIVGAGAAFLTKGLANILLVTASEKYLAKLQVSFADRVAANLFGGTLAHMRRLSRQDMEWAILRSTAVAFRGLFSSAMTLLSSLSLSVLLFGLLVYTDWMLAVTLLAYLGAVLVIFHRLSRAALSRRGGEFTRASVRVHDAISNIVTAFREISVLAKQHLFLGELHSRREAVALAGAVNAILGQVPRIVLEVAMIMGLVGFFAYQESSATTQPDFGAIAVFLAGSLRMISALLPLQRAIMVLRFDAPQAESAHQILRWSASDDRDSGQGVPATDPGTGAGVSQDELGVRVVARNLTFRFSDSLDREPAISDVSMVIEAGTSVALIGPSGAGKSTLVDILLGLHSPAKGVVLCDGISPNALRTAHPGVMSYVPQKPGLVSGNVRENIALGIKPEDVDDRRVWEVLKDANLESVVHQLPDLLHADLGGHQEGLSGGQLQRLGLARALYSNPRLLVLDEATSALDADNEDFVSQTLKKLRGRTTTITIAHRLSTIQHVDNVFLVVGGKIVDSGSFQALVDRNEMVRRHSELLGLD